MKSLRTYINEKLIIKQKQIITISSKQELNDVILDRFKSHSGDLNNIDVSELKEDDFYSLFYNLRDAIKKNKITEIDISDWELKELYYRKFSMSGMFYECKTLKTIILPDCLEVIGSSAFENCIGLTSVTIPESVSVISKRAFAYCSGLTNIIIPGSVSKIGYETFYSCTRLTSVIIPDSVNSIGQWAFRECNNLKSITIPNSVTLIGRLAFDECPNLTITVPNERVKKLVVDSVFKGEIIIK